MFLLILVVSMTWWRHQMEAFSALLAIYAENSPVPGEFPTQRPVTRSFDVCFDLRLDKRLSKQSWGWWFETLSRPFWRHSNETTAFELDWYHHLTLSIETLIIRLCISYISASSYVLVSHFLCVTHWWILFISLFNFHIRQCSVECFWTYIFFNSGILWWTWNIWHMVKEQFVYCDFSLYIYIQGMNIMRVK